MNHLSFVLVLLLVATGCAGQVSGPDAPALKLPDYETGAVQCAADAPSLAFDGCGEPTTISPDSPVATVCHCIGGVYACFGHPGQPTCDNPPDSEPAKCMASTIGVSPVLASVCPGDDPIIVQCEKIIVLRSDMNSIIGTNAKCTHPPGPAAIELPYVACCYFGAMPSNGGAAL